MAGKARDLTDTQLFRTGSGFMGAPWAASARWGRPHEAGELITAVELPPLDAAARSTYAKIRC